ncbi:PD-(D/E)XK nuclease-like domain-containing protein (plasmid) [Comamonas aquatica]|nr:PD-(D/E)XK nuclease-like domain-containing protein [Comamonas aquatica]
MSTVDTVRTAKNSNREYHSDVDVYSSTMLKNALVSPAHFIQGLLHRFKGSRSTDFGTLLHALILEPHTVDEIIAIYPDDFTRLKDCTAFKEKNKERYCLTLREFVEAQNLADKTLNSKFRGRHFYKFVEEGIVEESIYYSDPVTGLACRTRLDLKHPEFTFDVKSTRYSDTSLFSRQACDLHYDLSAYMYTLSRFLHEQKTEVDARKPKPFVLIPVCSEAPHSVYFMPCSVDFLQNGKSKYEHALAIIKACTDVQSWPTLGGEKEIDIAPWQKYTPTDSALFALSH